MANAKKAVKKAAPKKATPKKAVKKAAPKKAAPKKAAPKPPSSVIGVTRGAAGPRGGETAAATSATVHVRFDNTNAGTSDFTATHNNQNPQRLTQTGDIHFDGVKRGDTIEISSDSPGDTIVTVSGVNTNPVRMTAVPGQHLGDFFVVVS